MNKKVTIYISKSINEKLTELCKKEGYSKSKLIEILIKDFLNNKGIK